jgi:DNA-binding NtrC family response regulator
MRCASRRRAEPRKKKVLVVDDDARSREALSELLALEGVEVEIACDARDAVGKLRHHSFDAVLSDVMMPGNGHSVVDYVESIQPQAAVIVISACDESDETRDSIERHAFRWLSKPVSADELRSALHELFELAQPHS